MSALSFLVVGNWKMHGTRAEASALAQSLAKRQAPSAEGSPSRPQIVLCPPHPLLELVGRCVAGSLLHLGGQDCSCASFGPRTGEVAAAMLRDLGCTYVLAGHSERRALHAETDADVRVKVEAAQGEGLTAIVCVGEHASVRREGHAEAHVTAQVLASLPNEPAPARTVIAYEPIWSIGTGRTPTVAEIEAMHGAIREVLVNVHGAGPWRILYGGSVRADNAGRIGGATGVDGLLVGSASLQAEEFWGISEAVSPSRTDAS